MGSVLGRISVETPKYQVLSSCAEYEIRHYAPPSSPRSPTPLPVQRQPRRRLQSPRRLHRRPGQPPERQAREDRHDRPGDHQEREDSHDGPGDHPRPDRGRGGEDEAVTMRFVLPAKYGRAEEAPRPLDERVVLRDEEGRKYGVVRFGGVATEGVAREKAERLREWLERTGIRWRGSGCWRGTIRRGRCLR
ncbi:hypothetical protein BT93_L3555 [Corymbia citriodora subsp. variegata]|uniref:Uncharacterized protein n=1 Tax=Corymbia citriodora subsp. variegata TaxID=360336 RepID=A0A8T0CH35_CORYI|nr:hypothetical protein BT93_L3555 [Corymbia citriodora subsp. variegata]